MSEATITETLTRLIMAGPETTEAHISIGAAWQLAGELAGMQMIPIQTQADIYGMMKDGGFRFKDRAIVVAHA